MITIIIIIMTTYSYLIVRYLLHVFLYLKPKHRISSKKETQRSQWLHPPLILEGVCKNYQKQDGAPEWLSQLSIHLSVLAQVMISWFQDFKPHTGLWADGTEPAWNSLSPSLSTPPPTQAVHVSLKINK